MQQTVVIKVTPFQMRTITQHYEKYSRSKLPPYAIFASQVGKTIITGYQSGKVMFQGPTAEQEAARWVTSTSNQTNHKNSSTLPSNFDQKAIIGSDEVGNGSYFGPLIVCATFVNDSQINELKKMGVRDSKELTDESIQALAPKLKKLLPYKLLIVTPQKYNTIQPKYNAVHMKAVLHNQAIYLLQQNLIQKKVEIDGVLIDQFTPEKNYRKYIANEPHQVNLPTWFITKGESYHLSVAAASIICRATFLAELTKASTELGLKIPSGAGSKSDEVAAKILKIGGLELLAKYAKLHFANTEKAKNIAEIQIK